jgi:hypothetical protein
MGVLSTLSLPKRASTLINGRTVLTRHLTRLVAVVTTYEGFSGTASSSCVAPLNLGQFFLHAIVVDIPFPNLLEKQYLIVLVAGPAHVKNVGMYLAIKERMHVLP